MKMQLWKVSLRDEDNIEYKTGEVKTSLSCTRKQAQVKSWNKYMKNGQGLKCVVTKEGLQNV